MNRSELKKFKKNIIFYVTSQYDSASLNCSGPEYIPRWEKPMILSLHPGVTFVKLSINVYTMLVTKIIPRNIATDISTMETVVGAACFGSTTDFFGACNKKLILSLP